MRILQYHRDYQTFVSTARYWTEAFAKTSSLGAEEKVRFTICCWHASKLVFCILTRGTSVHIASFTEEIIPGK